MFYYTNSKKQYSTRNFLKKYKNKRTRRFLFVLWTIKQEPVWWFQKHFPRYWIIHRFVGKVYRLFNYDIPNFFYNVWKYLPILWNCKHFDEYAILENLAHTIKIMEENFERSIYKDHSKKTIRRMKSVRGHIKRYLNPNEFTPFNYPDEKPKFISIAETRTTKNGEDYLLYRLEDKNTEFMKKRRKHMKSKNEFHYNEIWRLLQKYTRIWYD